MVPVRNSVNGSTQKVNFSTSQNEKDEKTLQGLGLRLNTRGGVCVLKTFWKTMARLKGKDENFAVKDDYYPWSSIGGRSRILMTKRW